MWYVWFTVERSDVDSFRIRKDGKFVETFIEIFDNILSKFYCSILRPSVGFSCQLGGKAIFRSLHSISSVTKLRRRKLFFQSPNFLWFIRSIKKCWRTTRCRADVAPRLCFVSWPSHKTFSEGRWLSLTEVIAFRSVCPRSPPPGLRALSLIDILFSSLSLSLVLFFA